MLFDREPDAAGVKKAAGELEGVMNGDDRSSSASSSGTGSNEFNAISEFLFG